MRTENSARKRDQWRIVQMVSLGMIVPICTIALTIWVCLVTEPSDPIFLVVVLFWGGMIWIRHEIAELDLRSRQRTIISMSYLDCKIDHGCLHNDNCEICRQTVVAVSHEDGYPVQW